MRRFSDPGDCGFGPRTVVALLGRLWRSGPCPLWWDGLGAEGSPVYHSGLNTFISGDSASRPLTAPEAPLPFAVLPFPPPAWSAPPTVGAATASVSALGTRTFLNIPSFPGRAHPVDFFRAPLIPGPPYKSWGECEGGAWVSGLHRGRWLACGGVESGF